MVMADNTALFQLSSTVVRIVLVICNYTRSTVELTRFELVWETLLSHHPRYVMLLVYLQQRRRYMFSPARPHSFVCLSLCLTDC